MLRFVDPQTPKRLLACFLTFTLISVSTTGRAEEKPADNTLTAKEVQEGWILLFDGKTLYGWEAENPANAKDWMAKDGTITCDTKAGFNHIKSKSSFADFHLSLDFKVNSKGNSGIFFRGGNDGKPFVGPEGITGYEAQVDDNDPRGAKYTTGALYDKAPAAGLIKGENEWRHYDVIADGDHIITKINGEKMADFNDTTFTYGHFGLQHHNPGSVIEFKNIKLKPLGLKPIFNGKDLSGWKVLDKDPAAGKTSLKQSWTVKDGMLHVEVPAMPKVFLGGAGEIQTTDKFKDFVLQIDVKTNGKHLNSGLFFRGLADQVWQGYETQIRNQWMGEDRTKPVDFGTGGVYNQAKSRKVVSNDKEFFTKTVVACGPYIGVWINGEQVADFTDKRPQTDNARNGYCPNAGVIGLQSHDPSTNIDFKEIKVAELPTGE